MENENRLHFEDDESKIFRDHFQSGTLLHIAREAFLKGVRKDITFKDLANSRLNYLAVAHNSGDVSYVMYSTSGYTPIVRIFDRSSRGLLQGEAQMSAIDGTFSRDFMRTGFLYRGKGVDERMFDMMDALALAFTGSPITPATLKTA